MFLYDVTRRETFAEVMRVHGLILRSKNVEKEKGKAKGIIPMIVLANTRNTTPSPSTPSSASASAASPKLPTRSGSRSHHGTGNGPPDGSHVTAESGPFEQQQQQQGQGQERREVSTEEGLEFAYGCNCPFYEISSTSYADVLNAFQQLLGEIVKDQRKKTGATKLTNLGVKGSWRKSQLVSIVSSPSSDPSCGSSSSSSSSSEEAKAPEEGGKSGNQPKESSEDLHESLKGRQKAFRYTRVDTEEIKYLYTHPFHFSNSYAL
jgi:hypothetical protein